MVNHMALGARRIMGKGPFLAKTIGEAEKGRLSIEEAVELSERG